MKAMGSSFAKNLRARLHQPKGQAMVEYLLLAALVVTLFGILSAGLRAPLKGVWNFYLEQIVPGCPGCPYAGGRI